MKTRRVMMGVVLAGLLAVTGITQATTVASWPTDFSATQGVDNWYYLHTVNFDYNADETANQMTWNGTGFTGGDGGAYVSSSYILPGDVYNPGSGLRTSAVVRWVSEVTSNLQIAGSFQSIHGIINDPAVDGISAYVRVNGVEKWSAVIPATDGGAHAFNITVPGVQVGDDIDFLVFSIWHNWADETAMNATISTIPEPATIGLLTIGGLLLRRRK